MSEATRIGGDVRGRVLIVLPCYNEAPGIGDLLREIRALPDAFDTLVVDDGSADGTSEAARPLSPCVRLVENLGIGAAVHTGIRYAHERGYDFCAQVDGDGQHPPSEIGRLLEACRSEKANIVIGSRYIAGDGAQSTFPRRMGSRLIGRLIRRLFGQEITDPTSGFRVLDREAIVFFAEAYPHDFPEPIAVARALRGGLVVREVPVAMRDRRHGRSSITAWRAFGYMMRVIGYILLTVLGPEGGNDGNERSRDV